MHCYFYAKWQPVFEGHLTINANGLSFDFSCGRIFALKRIHKKCRQNQTSFVDKDENNSNAFRVVKFAKQDVKQIKFSLK